MMRHVLDYKYINMERTISLPKGTKASINDATFGEACSLLEKDMKATEDKENKIEDAELWLFLSGSEIKLTSRWKLVRKTP